MDWAATDVETLIRWVSRLLLHLSGNPPWLRTSTRVEILRAYGRWTNFLRICTS